MNYKAVILASVVWFVACEAQAVTCSATSSGVAFGTYRPNQPEPADTAGRITIACDKGALDALPMTVSYAIEISRGQATSYSPRLMSGGIGTLQYNLFRDPSRSLVWGDNTGGTASLSGSMQLPAPAGSAADTHSIYGRIFPAQNAVPGNYSDSVLVTVSY